MYRTSCSLAALVFGLVGLISAAGCNATTGEGVSGCNGNGDCPGAFPICRADLRCWSTPDPGVDSATLDGGARDGGSDRDAARAQDGAAADTGGGDVDTGGGNVDSGGSDVDSSLPPTDGAAMGTDSGSTGVDSGPGTDGGSGSDGGPGSDGGTGSDSGGPCSGAPMTTFYRDADGDAHGAAASGTMMRCSAGGGYVASNDDCNDANPTVYPGATEFCNGVDDDCVGGVDGASASAMCTVAHGVGACVSGACDIASCTAPFDDCDTVTATGCETNTATTADHCGGCALPCGVADSCAASACVASPWVQVSGGADSFCARRANGLVACWGSNQNGVVAPSMALAMTYPPRTLAGITGSIDVAVSYGAGCSVGTDGSVWCWGDTEALGPSPGPRVPRSTPAPVPGITNAVDVALNLGGAAAACAVLSTGRVMCWGTGVLLGDGSTTTRLTPGNITGVTDAVSIEAAVDAFCVRRSSGRLSCWSAGTSLLCGDGIGSCQLPVTVATISDAGALLAMNAGQFCARRTAGAVLCWGNVVQPDLTATDTNTPIAFPFAITAAGGTRFPGTRCISRAGGVECWGNNTMGGLGRGTMTGTLPIGSTIVTVNATQLTSGGQTGTCAVDTVARVWCWGANGGVPSSSTPAILLTP